MKKPHKLNWKWNAFLLEVSEARISTRKTTHVKPSRQAKNRLSKHTVLLTISYHLFWFLIGWYSVVEIWYFIKKRKENGINTIFLMKNNKVCLCQESIFKYKEYSLLWIHPIDPWCNMLETLDIQKI